MEEKVVECYFLKIHKLLHHLINMKEIRFSRTIMLWKLSMKFNSHLLIQSSIRSFEYLHLLPRIKIGLPASMTTYLNPK